jgi:HPt (histidine-containing phosphotransfer) domain-containing protein
MSDFKALDLSLLKGYKENLSNEVMLQMLSLYQQQSATYLVEIEQALEKDQDTWQKCCHKMKGAAGSVGFVEVHALLVKMEKTITSEKEKRDSLRLLQQLNLAAISEFNVWLVN